MSFINCHYQFSFGISSRLHLSIVEKFKVISNFDHFYCIHMLLESLPESQCHLFLASTNAIFSANFFANLFSNLVNGSRMLHIVLLNIHSLSFQSSIEYNFHYLKKRDKLAISFTIYPLFSCYCEPCNQITTSLHP